MENMELVKEEVIVVYKNNFIFNLIYIFKFM